MSVGELMVYLPSLVLSSVLAILGVFITGLAFLLSLMRGQIGVQEKANKDMEMLKSKKKSKHFFVFFRFGSGLILSLKYQNILEYSTYYCVSKK